MTELPEPCLVLRNLSKTFSGTRALKSVSMQVLPGEIHALVGQNGSGKSTLIKCLCGYQNPDPDPDCEITVGGAKAPIPYSPRKAAELGMAFVHQDLGVVPSLTVLENFCLGRGFATGPLMTIKWRQEADRARRLMAEFGHATDPMVELRRLPSSTRTIIAIVRALASLGNTAHLLVLDEPTAALPQAEVDFLFDAVRNAAARGVAVVYVSHRLQEIFLLADRVTVLRDGAVVGTFRVADLTEVDLVELMIGRKLDGYYSPVDTDPVGQVLLEADGLFGERLENVSLALRRGEVVGVAGLLGSGCSELGRLIFGAQRPRAGTIRFKGRKVCYNNPADAIRDGIAMISENRHVDGCFLSMTAEENITVTDLERFFRHGRIDRKAQRRETAELMSKFCVVPPEPSRRFSQFSGGNQQKSIVAKWMRLNPDFLICDEPVVGVDVGAKREIYNTLRIASENGTTIMLISSELKDLVSMCSRVLVLANGRLVAELSGSDLTEERLGNCVHVARGSGATR